MPAITDEDIRRILAQVTDPLSGQDVISAGLISSMVVRDGNIGFLITIEPGQQAIRGILPTLCEAALMTLDGVTKVTAVLTAQSVGTPSPHQSSHDTGGTNAGPERARAQWNVTPVQNVQRIIAVSSGKGGVGKSTIAAGLALAMAARGRRVGLLDLDLYGPSLPRMMGIRQKPEMRDGCLVPPLAQGIQCLSMGLMMGDQATVVRAPIITKTLQQMLRATWWGAEGLPLETLVIDLPPGTGDIQLSLAQAAPMAHQGGGALIVTTPQAVATEDAHKAAQMWQKVGVPMLGIIENMSWFDDPSGHRHALFGEGGGQSLADAFDVPLLAQFPLTPDLREQADAGRIDPAPFAALAARLASR